VSLSVKEVDRLRVQIARALASGKLSGFEAQFLASHAERLERHGTHAMITAGQRLRIDEAVAKAGALRSDS
jgi:hypothetical protein